MRQAASKILLAAFLVVSTNARAASVNLVFNGDFVNLDGWTRSGPHSGDYPDTENVAPYTFYFIQHSGNLGYLDQTIDTVVGQEYKFSVSFANGPSGVFNAYFGDQQLASINGQAFNWSTFSNVFTATSSQTDIDFSFSNSASASELSEVSVTAVPLPGALSLFASGLLGLSGFVWRRVHLEKNRKVIRSLRDLA